MGVGAGGGEVVHRARLHGEIDSGNPPGAVTAWMLPPWVCAFPEYHKSMTSPFTLTAGSLHRSQGNDLPVQDHARESLVPGSLQRLGQFRGLLGQHGDDLVDVPVGSGPGDAVVPGQRVGGGAVAEPPQPHHGLPRAGQRPAAARGTAAAALSQQQFRGELHQFPGDVKRGTIGDHMEPFVEGDLWRDLLLLGLHVPFRAAGFLRVSVSMCLLGHDSHLAATSE